MHVDPRHNNLPATPDRGVAKRNVACSPELRRRSGNQPGLVITSAELDVITSAEPDPITSAEPVAIT